MAKQVIQIADKPTLDVVKHSIWLNDYKTYGADSFVYNNTDFLYELYSDYELTLHDKNIRDETIRFAINNNEVGKAFGSIYGVDSNALEGIYTTSDLANSEVAMEAITQNLVCMRTMPLILANTSLLREVTNSEIAMKYITGEHEAMYWLLQDTTFVNLVKSSTVAVEAIANSATAMKAIIENETNGTTLITALAEISSFMYSACSNNAVMNALYDYATSYESQVEIFLASSYLLSACQASLAYEVTENIESVTINSMSITRTHYSGRCLVLGMSQKCASYNSTGYGNSYVYDLQGSSIRMSSSMMSSSYGDTGLKWRINKFASNARCHPWYRSDVSVSTTEPSYMAYLKL